MKKFRLINRLAGWITFIIAAAVYLMTIEPTASFWDCGEFISSSYKLEVGHPPGAPLFMIIGRFFSLFAGSPSNVAMMINAMSALASAFTILFLFWSITHIALKIAVKEDEEPTLSQAIAILGSSFVGAMAYTFSDTFWFSAVEGEVYAMSSLFTAMVFWAMLKWENEANEKYANRWIILIAYLVGLSIGVHLLNLLAIPAMVFIYYFKKYDVSLGGIVKFTLISLVLLGSIMYGIIPGVIWLATQFELIFVNGFGLPYKTGVLVYVALLSGALIYGLYFTIQKRYVLLNTILTAVAVIILGYSSFAIIVIRSLADTPMEQNNPDNVFSLMSYLNREQYGDRPLFFGQYFNAQPIEIEYGKPTYVQRNGIYEVAEKKMSYKYDPEYTTFFPRMYSAYDPQHLKGYYEWTDLPGTPEQPTQMKPSFGQNLQFFFTYQLNFMYLRYFMWNFAGRQNDIQGHGNILHGNWLSGIPFIDDTRLGDQSKLPENLKNNPARNKYYMLPLLLGLLGILFHYIRRNDDFWVVFLLFILTGLAIVVYLNQTPYQPRERDYAYAGSFYAFAIWIGLGVYALYELISTKVPKAAVAVAVGVTVITFVAVPVLMATENWDDHDRSDRYTARDFAYNYLNSCAPNAIIFTNGDNDTFPLWYAQEVEGVRTDVRVINLSYLNTDWYIDQMKRKAYLSEPVPFSMEREQYGVGKRDGVSIEERTKKRMELKDIIAFVASDAIEAKQPGTNDNFIPGRQVRVSIDSATIMKNKVIAVKDTGRMVKEINFDLKGSYLTKADLMVLDLIASSKWKRPIYFATTVGPSNYLGLEPYFQLDGMAYKLVPIRTQTDGYTVGHINTDTLYTHLMKVFRWGGIDKKHVYLDENNIRMLMNIRSNFARLAEALILEGKRKKAIEVLDKCIELIPDDRVPYNYYNLLMAENYYKAGAADKANKILETIGDNEYRNLLFYISLPADKAGKLDDEDQRSAALLNYCIQLATDNGQTKLADDLKTKFNSLL